MSNTLHVLIVEDNEDDYFLLQEMLTLSDDIEVVILHETHLQKAINLGNQTKVEVAIIDLSLPDSYGLETFLTFHQQHPSIPTIIMTGARDQERALEAVRLGAQDYLFKGESSATTIIRSIRYAIERQRLMSELKEALSIVKQLQGLLPICAVCKNVRDDEGYWKSVESYISAHSDVKFSHSICPECAKEHYKEFLGANQDS